MGRGFAGLACGLALAVAAASLVPCPPKAAELPPGAERVVHAAHAMGEEHGDGAEEHDAMLIMYAPCTCGCGQRAPARAGVAPLDPGLLEEKVTLLAAPRVRAAAARAPVRPWRPLDAPDAVPRAA